MEVPIYLAEINDKAESGWSYTSLVDFPAIKMKWQTFADDKGVALQFSINQEKQMIAGPALVADLPLKRRENGQEYYVIYTAPVIRKVAEKFAAQNNFNNVNLMHSSVKPKGVHLMEFFIIDRARGINPPKGYENLTDGSLWMGHKIDDKALFEQCKDKFQGYSIEGYFDLYPQDDEEQSVMEELTSVLTKAKSYLN